MGSYFPQGMLCTFLSYRHLYWSGQYLTRGALVVVDGDSVSLELPVVSQSLGAQVAVESANGNAVLPLGSGLGKEV